jgi:type IV pilus assembly protein PilB
MARKRLGEILVQAGVLDASGLRAGLSEQRRWGGPLGRILIDMKLISEDVLVQALAQQLNFPTVAIEGMEIPAEVVGLISGEIAEQFSVVPFAVNGKFLDVAMSDPTNLGVVDEVRIRTQLNVRPYLAGPKAIERTIAKVYGRGMASAGWDPRAGTSQSRSITFAPHGGIELDMADPGKPLEVVRGSEHEVAEAGLLPSAGSQRPQTRDREIAALQERISRLESLVQRDEDVLRKLLSLLIEKGVATREEVLERIR